MNTDELNALAKRVHKLNEKWWQNPVTKRRIERNKGELLMLVITELAEACEGERKDLMDDKLPHRKMAEVEMADAVIRLLDFADGFNYKLIHAPGCWLGENKGEAILKICNTILEAYSRESDSEICGQFINACIKDIEVYCNQHGYDLYGALEEKLSYNTTRLDHTHEARLQTEGKKW